MTGAPLRLGLVGCGRLAEQGYAPAVAGLADAEIVAVADPDAGRRARLAAQVGGPAGPVAAHPDAATLVAAGGLDAVVVASPVERHVDDAALAAGAGLVTLVEKPPAPDLGGARRLAALDPRPWVGFNRRFDLGARRARAAVPVRGRFRVDLEIAYRRASWQPHTVADDVLLDLGPHVVDLAAWLTGGPVRAVRRAAVTPTRATAVLDLDRGAVGLSICCDAPYHEEIVVRDDSGVVFARETLGGPLAAIRGRLRPGPHPLVASLSREVAAVVAAARGAGRGALADAADGVAAMSVIAAVRAAAADDRSVPVDPEDVPCS